MKMSLISILLACIALLLANNALGQGQGFGFGFPFQFPFPNPLIPLSKDGAPNSNQGGFPELNPEQKKCMQSFMDKNMGSCLQDVGNFFQTQKIAVNPTCCTALQSMDDACKPVIHFQNPFIQMHCSRGGATGSGSGSGFGDETGPGSAPASRPESSTSVGDGSGASGSGGPSFL